MTDIPDQSQFVAADTPSIEEVTQLVVTEAEDNLHGNAIRARPKFLLRVCELLIAAGITMKSDSEQLRLRLQTIYTLHPYLFYLDGFPPLRNLDALKSVKIAKWETQKPRRGGPRGTTGTRRYRA